MKFIQKLTLIFITGIFAMLCCLIVTGNLPIPWKAPESSPVISYTYGRYTVKNVKEPNLTGDKTLLIKLDT